MPEGLLHHLAKRVELAATTWAGGPECIESTAVGAASRRPSSWNRMSQSEADRVFSARKGQGAQATSSERRHILSTSRKGGSSTSRMVEVVHVRRSGAGPAEGRLQAASRETGTEAWLEDFR